MNQTLAAKIFLVEDDADLRDLLSVVFAQVGYKLTCFPDSSSFLAAVSLDPPDPVLLDIQLPGSSGLDTLGQLNTRHFAAPIIILSARREIPIVVDAIKRGAHDFIEKPFTVHHLTERVRATIENRRRGTAEARGVKPGIQSVKGQDLLTPRELEVLEKLVSGATNKEAGQQLGISPRTIEVHRSRIMEKLRARNTAALMRIVFESRIFEHNLSQNKTFVRCAGNIGPYPPAYSELMPSAAKFEH